MPRSLQLTCVLFSFSPHSLTHISVHPINISTNVQKQPWFLKLNPNGRIPVLVDRNRNDFAVFETAAILLYLEQHYDPTFKFSFDQRTQPEEWSRMLQWMFFAVCALYLFEGGALWG